MPVDESTLTGLINTLVTAQQAQNAAQDASVADQLAADAAKAKAAASANALAPAQQALDDAITAIVSFKNAGYQNPQPAAPGNGGNTAPAGDGGTGAAA